MTDNFLYHEVSEKEKQEIQLEAKEIMDSFSKKLDKIKVKMDEPLVERDAGERVEGKSGKQEIDREIMFENAPSKNKDFIIAEKKGW